MDWVVALPALPFFTSLIPITILQIRSKGLRGIPEFPPSVRDDFDAHRPWEQLYKEDKSGIVLAMLMAVPVLFLSHYDPVVFGMVAAPYPGRSCWAGLLGPVLFNPGVEGPSADKTSYTGRFGRLELVAREKMVTGYRPHTQAALTVGVGHSADSGWSKWERC